MQRASVRHSVPQGQDREQVRRIVEVLCEHEMPRVAAIAQLAPATGRRLREAILAHLPRLNMRQSNTARSKSRKAPKVADLVPRRIKADDHIRDALRFAEQISPDVSHNLLAPGLMVDSHHSKIRKRPLK